MTNVVMHLILVTGLGLRLEYVSKYQQSTPFVLRRMLIQYYEFVVLTPFSGSATAQAVSHIANLALTIGYIITFKVYKRTWTGKFAPLITFLSLIQIWKTNSKSRKVHMPIFLKTIASQ